MVHLLLRSKYYMHTFSKIQDTQYYSTCSYQLYPVPTSFTPHSHIQSHNHSSSVSSNGGRHDTAFFTSFFNIHEFILTCTWTYSRSTAVHCTCMYTAYIQARLDQVPVVHTSRLCPPTDHCHHHHPCHGTWSMFPWHSFDPSSSVRRVRSTPRVLCRRRPQCEFLGSSQKSRGMSQYYTVNTTVKHKSWESCRCPTKLN